MSVAPCSSCVRNLLWVIVASAAIGILVARPSDAAMWLRITVDRAFAQTPAAVTVTTLVMYGQTQCVDDPQASIAPNGTWYSAGSTPSEPSFRLVAYPAGRPDAAQDIALVHRAVDSPYWDGTVTFPAAGTWTVRMVKPNWGNAESETERCAGARIDVAVADGPASIPPPGLIALAIALVAVGVALVVRRTIRG